MLTLKKYSIKKVNCVEFLIISIIGFSDIEFYKGIYFLHKIWSNYKKRTNQPILEENSGLDKVQNYDEFVKKGNMFDKKTLLNNLNFIINKKAILKCKVAFY